MCGHMPVGEDEVIRVNMALANERNYTAEYIEALPEDVRAEVLDGQLFFMAAPTRTHQKLMMFLAGTFWNYIREHKGVCEVYTAPLGVYLDDDTLLEPDVVVICDPEKLDEKGCHGAPDFVAEIISPSTRSRDYLLKLNKYQKSGVREYWILDVNMNVVHVYNFEQEKMYSYRFTDQVPVHIFDDLQINFSEFASSAAARIVKNT